MTGSAYSRVVYVLVARQRPCYGLVLTDSTILCFIWFSFMWILDTFFRRSAVQWSGLLSQTSWARTTFCWSRGVHLHCALVFRYPPASDWLYFSVHPLWFRGVHCVLWMSSFLWFSPFTYLAAYGALGQVRWVPSYSVRGRGGGISFRLSS